MTDLIILVLIGAFFGGFTLGLTGFGNGLASYGVWLHVVSPQLAAPMVAIGSMLGHASMFRRFRETINLQRILPFIIGGALGIPVGTWLLTIISVPHFKLFGGILLTGYSALTLVGGTPAWTSLRIRTLDGIVGLLGGVCGGLASMSGPVLTIWCGLQGWSKDEQRSTYQPYHFAMHVMALTAFGVAGLLTMELLKLTAISLPATFAGVWLGRKLYERIDERQFRRVILWLLTLSGLALIWTGLQP